MKRRPPQSALTRSTDGGSDRVEHGVQFDPTPMLDNGGWLWGLGFLETLRVSFGFVGGTGPTPCAL